MDRVQEMYPDKPHDWPYYLDDSDEFSQANIACEGVPAWTLNHVIESTGFAKERLAGFLDISPKTLDRYLEDENKKLSPMKSELILKMMTLYRKGIDIFGDASAFRRWLDKPALGLANRKPIDYLHTSGGIELVRNLLLRIEFGNLA